MQALDKLQADWEAAELTILDFRDSGTCVVRLDEAMVQQLDDHIVMLQSMSFSPHRKPFEERLAKWDATLNLVSGACPASAAAAGGAEAAAMCDAACLAPQHAGCMHVSETGLCRAVLCATSCVRR